MDNTIGFCAKDFSSFCSAKIVGVRTLSIKLYDHNLILIGWILYND